MNAIVLPRFASLASLTAVLSLALLTTACGERASTSSAQTSAPAAPAQASSPAASRYDTAKMDLKPAPAKVTSERHSGVYAEGSALSTTAALKPLDPSPVKTIRLDTTHKIIEIAPGVRFSAWTFGDQVPGPTVHARVGDRIKFSMTNRSDEPVPGPRMTAAPMMHSMDFHAAMVSPEDKYRSIAPGQTIEFEFTLNYPGVFMYHCGTPMTLEHIASGMYGAVVVEPREGYPTKVDREYVIIQSEFYVKPAPGNAKVEGVPLYVLDGDRLRNAQSTYTVFNGVHNGMMRNPLPVKAGERVRLYVLNVGPSKTSSFHVVGTIFDRVWMEGNPDNQFRGMQTVLLGSSNSAIVEFMIPEEGSYVMVDHHFANASQGAVGLLSTGAAGENATEHHNIAASPTPTDPDAAQAKLQFESKCLACHALVGGRGKKIGPDLAGVTKRRSDDWLRRWLKSPEDMLATDPDAKALLKEHNNLPMPNQNLSDKEINGLIKYFHWVDSNPATPAPAAAGQGKS
ncbi:MAG TPA: multicopper oxidase domain-containing protein [Noviherbaspirillum sp.]|uniref:multicopper oxidase domain-containing protein n=1 Tax=Noviherbaspirillum sp. TaxID=1926288 RepID=UPI002B45C6D7|nr:multicopper oxidase domain-containing protein [Noviherbaspirillum sp.]HJV87394.1 multicopper oxidase domain-containing protein [Noviherbaspirillum sp.]